MMEVRHLPPRRHVFITNRFLSLFRMTDAKFDEFMQQHVTRWRDVNKILAALTKQIKKKKYPSRNADEQQRLLKSVHNFIGVASNNQHGQLIVDYLNGRTRRGIRESVLKGLDKTPAVIANTIKLANACAPVTRQYVDQQLNSIRFNLLKMGGRPGPDIKKSARFIKSQSGRRGGVHPPQIFV